MKTAKLDRETRLIELVETHNIARCISRLNDGHNYVWTRTRRALFHAILMESGMSHEQLEKVRIALEIP